MREMVRRSLIPAEHFLCGRQGELADLPLNFRIVVAADLYSVAINAKSGGQERHAAISLGGRQRPCRCSVSRSS
jgi:hypothetical protein